jgi:transposase
MVDVHGMNTPYTFVSPLNKAQRLLLQQIIKTDSSARVRMRAHSIVLSAKRYRLDEIANIFDIYPHTVSSWLDQWEERGVES